MTYDRRQAAAYDANALRRNVEKEVEEARKLEEKLYETVKNLSTHLNLLGDADEGILDHEDFDKARQKLEHLLGPMGLPQVNIARMYVRQLLKDRPAKR